MSISVEIMSVWIALVLQVVTVTWWASRVTTRLDFYIDTIIKLDSKLSLMQDTYVKKDDYNRHQEANRQQISELRDYCETIIEKNLTVYKKT